MSLVDKLIKEVKALDAAGKKKFSSAMGGIFKGTAGGKSIDPLGNLTGAGDELTRRVEARQELLKTMGANAEEASAKISQLEEASFDLFQSTEQGLQAFKSLGSSMQAFSFISADTTIKLAEGAMVLEKFGVSTETLGGILDTAALSFGATEKELMSLTKELGTVVAKFPGQAAQISQNFKNAQQNLAYDSGKIMTVFKKLQATSSQTGVSFDSLTNSFGTSMDSFGESSKKAGNLNAILGKSVFNSIDLLGKSEAERVETIIAGVKKNVNVESLKKNKFQLKSVAAGLGLSVDETRRLLSGKTTVDAALKGKESKDPRVKAQKMATEAMNAQTMELSELSNMFREFRTPFQNLIIATSAEQRRALLDEVKNLAGGEFLKRSDIVNMPDLVAAFQSMSQSALADNSRLREEFNKLLSNTTNGGAESFKALASFVKNNVSSYADMTPEERKRLNQGVTPGGLTGSDKAVKQIVKGTTSAMKKLYKSVTHSAAEVGQHVAQAIRGTEYSIKLEDSAGKIIGNGKMTSTNPVKPSKLATAAGKP